MTRITINEQLTESQELVRTIKALKLSTPIYNALLNYRVISESLCEIEGFPAKYASVRQWFYNEKIPPYFVPVLRGYVKAVETIAKEVKDMDIKLMRKKLREALRAQVKG